MSLEPETDREIFISLNGEVKQLRETIERFGGALMILEQTKFVNHENRINALEKSEDERKGMWKFVVAVGIILSIASTVIAIKMFTP